MTRARRTGPRPRSGHGTPPTPPPGPHLGRRRLCWFAAGLLFRAEDPWFTAASALWLVADALIALGLLGLLQSDAHGGRRLGTLAMVVALVARGLFAAGEAHSLLRGDDHTPLLPVAALLTAAAMTAYGITVWRAGTRAGVARVAPLLMGLYPVVAMFPLVAVTDDPPLVSIAGWGLVTALVASTASATRTPRVPGHDPEVVPRHAGR